MSDTTGPRLFGGGRLPIKVTGGCLDCDAYQVLAEKRPGLYRLEIHHDSTCPFLRSIEEAS